MAPKICTQRASMLRAHRVATKAYTALFKELRTALGADYDLLHERTELARQKMIAARENLNLHLATHRCLFKV